jgi:dienelactone hydrolase
LGAGSLRLVPEESLLDEDVNLRVEGLEPGARIRLACRLHDEAGTDWVSGAEFEASPDGVVDLAQSPVLSGTYEGRDPWGLFWSMVPDPPGRDQGKFSLHDISPLVFEIEAFSRERFLARIPMTRRIASEGLLREDVREGDLVGTLFLPPGPGPFPGVVDIVHSGGGLRHEPFAALLASRGFAVMTLATFGIPPLSRGLVEIPVERVGLALERMADHPRIDPGRLALSGTSKGAELALLAASVFGQVKAVAAFMPSCVLWSGVGRGYEKRPSWTLGGRPLPFVSPRYDQLAPRSREPLRLEPMYSAALSAIPEDHPARIPLERSGAAVLLLSPGDDAVMPSAAMGRQLEERLERARFRRPFRHVVYPGAGHLLGSDLLPGLPSSIRHTFHPLARFPIAYGGTTELTGAAVRAAWREMLAFLGENL